MPPLPLGRGASIASWACQLLAAITLAQTLYFKLTGAEESRFIFASVGAEPWGRIAAAVAELAAVVLLLLPRTAAWGALLAAGVMLGAIATHALVLGIEVQGDGGLLFGLALLVLACSAAVLWIRRGDLRMIAIS